MTKQELEALVASHGLTIDGWHGGAGKFRDLEIGVGTLHEPLLSLRNALTGRNIQSKLAYVNNPDHPNYGKVYLEVESFWWE